MKTVIQAHGRGTSIRRGSLPRWATGRCPSAILALIMGAGTILPLGGCRSREYPYSAHGSVYPDDPSADAMREPYYPPGYPRGPHPRFARGSRFPSGASARGGAIPPGPDGSYFWNGDHLKGSPSIRIDLRAQRAYFYKGRELAGVSPVSTGRPGYYTPSGSFRITQKSPNHRSNLYGDFVDTHGNIVKGNVDIRRDEAPPGTKFRGASMPYFLRFNGAVGMHAGYLPGHPASSGCVRLPEDMARHFFANAPTGTPVVVVR